MPLIKGKSKKAFEHNLKAELHAGKPKDQALAIAYDVKRRHMAEGGEVHMDKPKSIAEGIRRKKKMMAEGGEVDLQSNNADEHLNLEDDLSFEAARKDTYYHDDELEDQPTDSNEHGHELSDEDEHNAGMIASIMKKMRSKRM